MTLTTAQLATVYNEAIDAFSLSISPVKKFSTLGDAQRRVAALCEKHGLELCERDGKSPLLVKRTNAVSNTDEFEMSQAERDAQTRPTVAADEAGSDAPADAADSAAEPTTEDAAVSTTNDAEATPVVATANDQLAAHTKRNREKTAKEPTERKPRTPRVSREPRRISEIHECRVGTNQAYLVDMLFDGATLEAMTHDLNAKQGKSLSESVVYSTILYDVCTVKGYGVTSKLTEDGKPFFKLVLPAGMPRPLPHMPRKAKAETEAKP